MESMEINKQEFKDAVVKHLGQSGITLKKATQREAFNAVSKAAMEIVMRNWMDTKGQTEEKEVKQAFYLSAEFLMGRAFSNNLVNLTVFEAVKEVVKEMGLNINELEDQEDDAGLGNGGLGRLAACFLDSLATLELPGHGYGIRYKYGMFKQNIENGFQVEYPDNWLAHGDPWEVERRSAAVTVKFGGEVITVTDLDGREHFRRESAEEVLAVPYDMPIIGYGSKTVNTLRLWQAESPEGFDLQAFNDQDYVAAVKQQTRAEDISRVLYPNDSGPSGKELRLRQQYFFVSASLQDIMRKFKKKYGNNFDLLPEKVAVQLNDTHPVVAIPELMRLLMDWEKLEWEQAWAICQKVFAYTNHTILAEALEKWPIDLFSNLLPRIYQICEEINRRFLAEIREKFPNDWARHNRMAIIGDGMIKMAWLAIAGSHTVNGVAALHTEILKNAELKDWYELYPEKFQNKTNGVTQRRWLLKSNPELSELITDLIGDKWITDLSELKKLEKYADDDKVLDKFMAVKLEKKEQLAAYIKEVTGVVLDTDSLFDIQIKRLHEYKRQLMNILHIMDLYNRIKEYPEIDVKPKTFIFGAKAASGYRRAKQIIKLINAVALKVNNDPDVKGLIKIVFVPNYRVSVAEKLFPACDLSEQISTAGKEASGTGNMKFMINGAPTIGTMDGANVEIVEEAGIENNYIFGLSSDEVKELNETGQYNPWDEVNTVSGLKKVMDQLIDGTYSDDKSMFTEIYHSLMYGSDGNRPDSYYILKDFASYRDAHLRVDIDYRDKKAWAKKAWLNIANSGKFSSDRTIQQYADEIWDIKKLVIK
jgi:starch phosphorylase